MNRGGVNSRRGSTIRPSSMPLPMRGRGGRGRGQGRARGQGRGIARGNELNGKPRSRRNSIEVKAGRKSKVGIEVKVDDKDQFDDTDLLNRSYDFAKEEEEKERIQREKREEEMRRLEEELDRIEREEEEKRRKAEEEKERSQGHKEEGRGQHKEENKPKQEAMQDERKWNRQKEARMAKKATWY